MDSRTMEHLMNPPIQYLLRGFLLTVPIEKLPTFSALLLVTSKSHVHGIHNIYKFGLPLKNVRVRTYNVKTNDVGINIKK